MSLRGLFAGALMLAALELVVSSDQSASRFGGLLSSIGAGVRYLLDPAVPAIPDRRKPASGSSTLDKLKNLSEDLNPTLIPLRHGPVPLLK